MPSSLYSVSFVVPALNEEMRIKDTVNEIILAAVALPGYEIILIDDGSCDGTLIEMRKIEQESRCVLVVSHDGNRGMGAAYKTGIKHANMDRVMLVPGDNQFTSESLSQLLSSIDGSDIVIPYHSNAGKVRSKFRRALSFLYTKLANWLSGFDVPYYNGTVVHKTDLIKSISIRTDGFAYQLEALVKLLQNGCSYTVVGISLKERDGGETKAFRLKNVYQVILVFYELLIHKNVK